MILEVIEHYGYSLKSNKMCCPFHHERTPSFVVYDSTDSWYCHGACGEGGDAIEFIKREEGLEFKEAKEKLLSILEITEEEWMENKDDVVVTTAQDNAPLSKEDLDKLKKELSFKSNNYRGIRDDVNRFYGHMSKIGEDGSVIARYYPETNTKGEVTGFKCRNHPKDFSYGKIGQTGIKSQLSGQFRFKGGGKYILITGGEEDKAAAYQMLKDSQKTSGYTGIHVVSPTTGEVSAAKQCALQYDFLDQYDVIVVGMDTDEAGQKAAQEVCNVLPKDKVKVATWSGKDPNQMLLDGMQNQFVRDFYNAKDLIKSGIATSADADEGLYDFLTAPKIPLPSQLHRLQAAMRGGIRSTGAIVNVIGDTSIGKSLLTDSWIYYWIFNSPLIPTVVSLERTKEELTIDLLSIHLEKNLTWFNDGHDAVDFLEKPEVKKLKENLLYDEEGKPRFFIIDEREGSIDILKRQMEKSSKVYDSMLMVIDPLTDFLRSQGTDVQEDFMMWQKLQKKNGLVFVNVLHTRKPQGNGEGGFKKTTEYDALGTGSFVQSADINIVINRDKMNTCPIERNTTYVDMPKCRGGVTGEICALYFDVETRKQYDRDDYFKTASGSEPRNAEPSDELDF